MKPYELLIRFKPDGLIAGAHVIEFNEYFNGIGEVHSFTKDSLKELVDLEISWISDSLHLTNRLETLSNLVKEQETTIKLLEESCNYKDTQLADKTEELSKLNNSLDKIQIELSEYKEKFDSELVRTEDGTSVLE